MPKPIKQKIVSQIDLDPAIKKFVVTYLNPKARLQGLYGHWEAMLDEASKLDWAIVDDLIRRLDYDDYFMATLYWKIVAAQVKARDNHACQRCGRGGPGLEAHHTTYQHHGSEHRHLEDLETLCAVCHDLEHGQVIHAVIHEWELMPMCGLDDLDLTVQGIYVPRRNDKEMKGRSSQSV